MHKPQISVIIPAWNEEQFIHRCLTSIKNQHAAIPFEVIVVDNNSRDSTAHLARSFKVRVFTETKQGASAARNLGARQATGQLLVFVDADCTIPSTHIDRVWSYFQKFPATDALAGPYIVNDTSAILRYLMDECAYYTRMFAFQKFLFGHQGFVAGNFAIKKRVFVAVGGFNERLNHVELMEDVELAVRLHQSGYRPIFDPQLAVYTTFRRMQRKPLRTAIFRTFHAWKHLTRLRTTSRTTLPKLSSQ